MCTAPAEYRLSLHRLDNNARVTWDALCRECAAAAVGEHNLDQPAQAEQTEGVA